MKAALWLVSILLIIVCVYSLKNKIWYVLRIVGCELIFIIALYLMAYTLLKIYPGIIDNILIENIHTNIFVILGIVFGLVFLYLIFLRVRYKKVDWNNLLLHIKDIVVAVIYILVTCDLFYAYRTNEIPRVSILLIAILMFLKIFFNKENKIRYREDFIKKPKASSDYPNSDLFPSREKQLKTFIDELDNYNEEPYSIMISGDWGIGKTSFVKALEENLSDDEFIWICAGAEKTDNEIMKALSLEIINILEKNRIYIRRTLISKYFMAFASVIDKTGKISDLLNVFDCESKLNYDITYRNYLNSKLRCLEKRIYIIIDDLDRCDDAYREKMFRIIRESTELENCKTIFLVGNTNPDTNKSDANRPGIWEPHYIEKYVSYKLELCEVTFEEIVQKYFSEIFTEEFLTEHPNVVKANNVESLNKYILEFSNNVMESIKHNENENSDQKDTQKENKYLEQKNILIKNTSNSRKVKRFLKDIERYIRYVEKGYDRFSDTLKKTAWIECIVAFNYLKNFAVDDYENYCHLNENNKDSFGESLSYNILFGINDKNMPSEERNLAYKYLKQIDVLDKQNVLTEKERYIREIRQGELEKSHIIDYLHMLKTKDDLDKVIEVIKHDDDLDISTARNYVDNMIYPFSNCIFYGCIIKNKDMYIMSKSLETLFKEWKFDVAFLKREYVKLGTDIIQYAISYNMIQLMSVLYIDNAINLVDSKCNGMIYDISSWYVALNKLYREDRFPVCGDELQKLSHIKELYMEKINMLNTDEYPNTAQTLSELKALFDICELWINIVDNIKIAKENNGDTVFSKYFKIFKDTITIKEALFTNYENLVEGLSAFEKAVNECDKEELKIYADTFFNIVHMLYKNYGEDYSVDKTQIDNTVQDLYILFRKNIDTSLLNQNPKCFRTEILLNKVKCKRSTPCPDHVRNLTSIQ